MSVFRAGGGGGGAAGISSDTRGNRRFPGEERPRRRWEGLAHALSHRGPPGCGADARRDVDKAPRTPRGAAAGPAQVRGAGGWAGRGPAGGQSAARHRPPARRALPARPACVAAGGARGRAGGGGQRVRGRRAGGRARARARRSCLRDAAPFSSVPSLRSFVRSLDCGGRGRLNVSASVPVPRVPSGTGTGASPLPRRSQVSSTGPRGRPRAAAGPRRAPAVPGVCPPRAPQAVLPRLRRPLLRAAPAGPGRRSSDGGSGGGRCGRAAGAAEGRGVRAAAPRGLPPRRSCRASGPGADTCPGRSGKRTGMSPEP